MDIRSSSLTGTAGEHLVMSRLLSRGHIAAIAPQGVMNFDIVVTSRDGTQQCAFQVKTSWEKGTDGGWHMSQKHEDPLSPQIFYAFVDLGRPMSSARELQAPVVYVLPSKIVADAITRSHLAWLNRPGKNGAKHNDTKFRRLAEDYTKICGPDFDLREGWLDIYRENWGQIDRLTDGSIHARPV